MDPASELLEQAAIVADAEGPVREVELKLFVPPSSIAALRSHPLLSERAIGPLRVARIDNRYFDTPERDLAQRRMALRLRRVGRRWVQTLKLAGIDDRALSERGEWEMPVVGPALELAALRATPFALLAVDRKAERSLAHRLQPVFTTNFRRESRMLRLPDGSEVEFAFDVGTISAGRGRTRRLLRICEVEIERKGDGSADLLRFAARLARDLPLIPLAASKAARGYRLADGAPLEPARTELPAPHRDAAPLAHLSQVLAACNGALLANVHALFEVASADAVPRAVTMEARTVGASATLEAAAPMPSAATLDDGIEFIHQARVAVRRMRSALRTFRPVAKGRRYDALDEQLRSMGQVFGQARDWDVFVTTTVERLDHEVATDASGHAALSAVRVEAALRRLDAHRALRAYLDAGAFGKTVIAVERMAARLADEPPGKRASTLAACAPAWLSSQRDRVTLRSRKIAVLDDDERHGLRVEVKRLRYALDLLEPLYDKGDVKDFHDALADLQDKLGKLNDAVVADLLVGSLCDADSHRLVQARFGEWLRRHVRKQLPKVAALSVALELTTQPWLAMPATADEPGEPVEGVS